MCADAGICANYLYSSNISSARGILAPVNGLRRTCQRGSTLRFRSRRSIRRSTTRIIEHKDHWNRVIFLGYGTWRMVVENQAFEGYNVHDSQIPIVDTEC